LSIKWPEQHQVGFSIGDDALDACYNFAEVPAPHVGNHNGDAQCSMSQQVIGTVRQDVI
jgi:hypothetical protein